MPLCKNSSICSAVCITQTVNPSLSSLPFITFCFGLRSFLSPSLISANTATPPGSSINLSGTESVPGELNFNAQPPACLTLFRNFASSLLSIRHRGSR